MDHRYQYIDTGKEADDFVKAFIAMSNNIRQNQYNAARIEYYRALTKKALSSGQGAFSTPEGKAAWDKIMRQQEEATKQRRQWMQEFLKPTTAPAEPAPKPRSDAEPAPEPAPKEAPPKAASETTPPAPADATPKKSAFLEDEATPQQQAALPEEEEAAPQQAVASAQPTNSFDDEKAIPA